MKKDMNMNEYRTDFLFAQPSFITGLGRLFDFGANSTNYNTSNDADTNALKSDWSLVGKDIKDSMILYERQNLKKSRA